MAPHAVPHYAANRRPAGFEVSDASHHLSDARCVLSLLFLLGEVTPGRALRRHHTLRVIGEAELLYLQMAKVVELATESPAVLRIARPTVHVGAPSRTDLLETERHLFIGPVGNPPPFIRQRMLAAAPQLTASKIAQRLKADRESALEPLSWRDGDRDRRQLARAAGPLHSP